MKNNHLLYKILTILFLFLLTCSAYSQPVTWFKTFGDPLKTMNGVSVVQTFDSGYAVLAFKGAYSGDEKLLLLKLDYLGKLKWLKYPLDTIINVSPIKVIQNNDSGFVILGLGNTNFLLKTDKNGNFLWIKNYPETAIYARFSNFTKSNDNGFILCGDCMISDPPYQVGYVLKTDSSGNIQWRRKYIDTTFSQFLDIIQFPDNNYYLAEKLNDQYWESAFIRKIDSAGKTVWLKFIADSAAANLLTKVQNDKISILSPIYPYNYNVSLIDTSGNIFWQNNFAFPHGSNTINSNSSGCSVISGSDMLNNSIGINKISFGGSSIFTKTFQYSGYDYIGKRSSAVTYDNGYIFTGLANINNKSSILVLKTDSLFNAPVITGITSNSQSISSNFQLYQNYPNPFNPITNIKYQIQKTGLVTLKIYDLLGREIKTLVNEVKNPGSYMVSFNGSEFASGVYFYRIQAGDFVEVKKMVLIK